MQLDMLQSTQTYQHAKSTQTYQHATVDPAMQRQQKQIENKFH